MKITDSARIIGAVIIRRADCVSFDIFAPLQEMVVFIVALLSLCSCITPSVDGKTLHRLGLTVKTALLGRELAQSAPIVGADCALRSPVTICTPLDNH